MANLTPTIPVLSVADRGGKKGFMLGGEFVAEDDLLATEYQVVVGPFDTITCRRCYPYFKTVWKLDDPKAPRFPLHPKCRHRLIPKVGQAGKGLSSVGPQSKLYRQYLAKKPRVLKSVVGPTRAAWVKEGLLDVDDLWDANHRLIHVDTLRNRLRKRPVAKGAVTTAVAADKKVSKVEKARQTFMKRYDAALAYSKSPMANRHIDDIGVVTPIVKGPKGKAAIPRVQWEAVTDYAKETFNDINTDLRRAKGKVKRIRDAFVRDQVAALDKASKVHVAAQDVIVHRASYGRWKTHYGFALTEDHVGAVITDHGFVSTALAKSGRAGHPDYYMEILVKKGQRFVAPGRIRAARFRSESEYLLPRGSKMRLWAVREEKGKKLAIMELIQ